jgi:hypothetical protein
MFDFDPLERRVHLSVSPSASLAECPEVTEARQDLQETIVQYRHDKRVLARDLADIRADIREEIVRLKAEDAEGFDAVIKPLQAELAEVVKEQGEAVQAARKIIEDKREEWAPVIAADVKAFLEARAGGDDDEIAAARTKIESDRNQLKAELKPLKDALDTVVTDSRAAIAEARKAIYDAYASLSPKLADLLEKLEDTATAGRDTMIANHNAVVAAQGILKEAISECDLEHPGEHNPTTA